LKRILFSLIILVIITVLIFITNITKKEEKLKKIKVAEVTHSIFYAPQYVAHSKGYFKEEGLDVEISLIPGADKVSAAVLSGDVEIGFCGPEATIYIYGAGEKDYLVNFAGLTQKDGSFIVSRKDIKNFTLEDLKGKKVIGGRKAVLHLIL
jgi:ABC-type nitrate/sulfonate/bicarbonate transport systems, periplasmic components